MTKHDQLLPPGNWEDFESLCLDVWRDLWRDPYAKKNGRRGQAQHGVDIFGHVSGLHSIAGVQCKGKDNFLNKNVTLNEIKNELAKTQSLPFKLSEFSLATTAPKDSTLEKDVISLSNVSQTTGGPKVTLWSWEDIRNEVLSNEAILFRNYPYLCPKSIRDRVVHGGGGGITFNLYASEYEEELQLFFNLPEILGRIEDNIRFELGTLTHEIARNAFHHGKATIVTIEISDSSIKIMDNGFEFSCLNPKIAKKSSGVGLKYLHKLIDKYDEEAEFSYKFSNKKNCLSVDFVANLSNELFDTRCEVKVLGDIKRSTFLRDSLIVPDGCSTYHFQMPDDYFGFSHIHMAMKHALSSIPNDTFLIIYLSKQDPRYDVLLDSINDPRVSFSTR